MDYFIKIKNAIEYMFEKIKRLFQSKFFLYFAIFLLALKIIVVCAFIGFPQNIFFADITKTALTNLVNQGRQKAGIQLLAENRKLDLAAKLKAEDMVQKEYFSHQSPEGATPWHWFETTGYNYKYAGENLAIGFFDSQDVYLAWLNSPTHRDNLLNPKYKEVGTAILSGFGPNNAIVVVQLFGNPAPAPAAPAPSLQNQTKPEIKPEKNIETKQPKNILEESASQEALSQYTENISFYSYDKFLQYTIYCFLALTFFVLFICFFGKHDSRQKLLFRFITIVAILSIAALLNKEAIYLISPRQIII